MKAAAITSRSSRPVEPATERGRRTRAAIVEAAASLMYQRGVSATSVDEVLELSGTGKSQLYHYFADRSDLVAAVIEYQINAVLQAQPAIHDIDSMSGLERWARQIIAIHTQPGGPFACPLGTIAAELKNDPAYVPAINDAFARWREPLADGLRTMVRNGELGRGERPDRLAAAILATLQGGMLLARLASDAAPLKDALNMALSDIRQRAQRQAERQAAAG